MVLFPMLMISSTLMISRLVLILTRMIMSAISSCSGRDANERRRRSELGKHHPGQCDISSSSSKSSLWLPQTLNQAPCRQCTCVGRAARIVAALQPGGEEMKRE